MSDEECESYETILEHFFPKVFDKMRVEDLEEISNKVAVFVDGMDEFKSLDEIKTVNHKKSFDKSSALTKSLYRLIEPKSNIFLERRVLLAGRPEACEILKAVIDDRTETKMVEVCGFNRENVNIYIDKTFKDKPELILTTKTKINESDNLRSMSTVPVYLWIICLLFGEDNTIDSPQTTTELFIYACLIYLSQHMKERFSKMNCKLHDICQRKDVLCLLMDVAKFSYKATLEGKVVFQEKGMKDFSTAKIAETGFIVKCCRNIKGIRVSVYQFRHLVLQEFLCALYLYRWNVKMATVINTARFRSCLPIVAGLQGLSSLSCEPSTIVQLFLQNIFKLCKCFFTDLFVKQPENVVDKLEDVFVTGDQPRFHWFEIEKKKNRLKEFLNVFFEFQGDFSLNAKKMLDGKRIIVGDTLFSEDTLYHHELRNILHFLSKLPSDVDIFQLTFKMKDNMLSMNEIKQFKKILPNLQRIKFNDLKLDAEKWAHILSLLKDRVDSSDIAGVTFSSCNLSENEFKMLKQVIPKIRELTLIYVQPVSCYALQCISNAIVKASSESGVGLKSLAINDCWVDDFSDLIPCIKFLIKLNLSQNVLSENNLRLIGNAISEARELQCLQIDYCKLDDKKMEFLKGLITSLEILSISGNMHLSFKSFEWISEEIIQASQVRDKMKCNLKRLILSNCNLSHKSLELLAACFALVHVIDISGNVLSLEDIAVISRSILNSVEEEKCNNKLTLYLKNCDITDDKLCLLAPCVPYMEGLDVSKNDHLTVKTLDSITQLIRNVDGKMNLKVIQINEKCFIEEERKTFFNDIENKVYISWCGDRLEYDLGTIYL